MGTQIAVDGSATSSVERLAAGSYVGILFAGVVAIAVALIEPSTAVLAGAAGTALLVGIGLGAAIAARSREVSTQIGGTLRRRLSLSIPAVPFAVLFVAAWIVPIDSTVATVALWTTIGLMVAGHVLARVSQSRHAATATAEEPAATWRWTPQSSPVADALLLVLWTGLGITNVIGGDLTAAAVWTVLGLLWAGSHLAGGHWRPRGIGANPEIRVHDAGLVTQRPFTRSLVPWETIDRVRLREGELVLDRGLFDVRFDAAELEDPEAILAAIERRIGNTDSRPRAAE